MATDDHESLDLSPLPGQTERLRLDKWLWAARFYKTRGLAADEIDKGRIEVNQQVAKPSRELKEGDRVLIRQGVVVRTVIVRALSTVRGPAPRRSACMRKPLRASSSAWPNKRPDAWALSRPRPSPRAAQPNATADI